MELSPRLLYLLFFQGKKDKNWFYFFLNENINSPILSYLFSPSSAVQCFCSFCVSLYSTSTYYFFLFRTVHFVPQASSSLVPFLFFFFFFLWQICFCNEQTPMHVFFFRLHVVSFFLSYFCLFTHFYLFIYFIY